MGKNADHSADLTRTENWKISEKVLEGRIAQTSAQVRRVDFFSALIAVLTLGASLLFAGILLDHHLFAHGLSKGARSVFFGTSFALLALYFLYRIFPLLRYRINPLYAADILERSRPSLKNGLINWFLLRRRRFGKQSPETQSPNSPLETRFYHELSVQTADELSTLSQEMVVDHSSIIRWGIAFVVIFALLSVYAISSPKSPFVSTARILFPTAEIEAPVAVRFHRIEPGNASFYQGKKVEIKAEIAGTRNQPVYFAYSTSDGRLIDQRIPMKSPGATLYELTFPTDETGLTESLDYRLIVGEPGRGESRSKAFRFDVRPAMSFGVTSVHYDYPPYSGLPPRQIENQGNLRALEGTRVKITARCNVPMERALFIPDFKMNEGKSMTISPNDPTIATLSFVLKNRPSEKNGAPLPEFTSYQLLCVDAEKNRNISEPENPNNDANCYQIEILTDPPPTIHWEKIPEGELQIPLDGQLDIRLVASDSEFGLKNVRIDFRHKETQGDAVLATKKEIPPLDLSASLTNPKKSSLTVTLSPEKLGLETGDSVEFQGIVTDNREPNSHQSETEPLTFTVTPPEGLKIESDSSKEEDKNAPSDESEKSDQKGEESDEKNSDSNEKDQSKEDQGKDDKSGEQEGEKEEESSDQNQESGQSDSPQKEEKGEGEKSESNPQGGEKSDHSDQETTDSNESENQEGEMEPGEGQNGNPNESSEKNDSSRPGQDVNQSPNNGKNGDQGDSAPAENGPSTNDDGEPNDSNGSGLPDDSESANKEKKGEKENPPTPAPIDPDANPGDAFETILDLANEAIDAEPASPNAAPQGIGTGITHPESKKKTSDKEVDPDQLKSAEGTPPTDAERQTDDSPDEIPTGAQREQGEVDPTSQNFMATAPQGNETSETSSVSPEANVTLDPDQKTEGTVADPKESQGRDAATDSSSDSEPSGVPDFDAPNPTSPTESNHPPVTPPADFTPPPGINGLPSGKPKEGENDKTSPESRSNGSNPNEEGTNANVQGGGGSALGTLSSGETAGAADRAHLAYSEKATSLALEYLDDQLQKGVDPELLNRLGWTEEELRQFRLKWKEMKENAENLPTSAPEKQDYLATLRDLGLRPPNQDGNLTATRKGDKFRTASPNRGTRRVDPPRDYRDRFQLYNQGISRQK